MPSIPIYLASDKNLAKLLSRLPAPARNFVKARQFKVKAGAALALPSAKGAIAAVIVADCGSMWDCAGLPKHLPSGNYRIDRAGMTDERYNALCLGFLLGRYQFNQFKKKASLGAELLGVSKGIEKTAAAIFRARDLINRPANDLTPAALAHEIKTLAKKYQAQCKVIVGDDLLKKNYPTIHAVGRAAEAAPCLIDMVWGDPRAPKVTLVGKGVCFDSGGLDLKSSSNMLLMKKDMGGAACALAVAEMVMAEKLPVRLRLLVPAVENAVAGNAMRPMDILKTRKGLTVEIGNTDAEGRLILCDALYEADQEKPDLLIDFATLTGAARVALGTEVPALFSNNDFLAEALLATATMEEDPLWRLPLWPSYRKHVDGKTADITNSPNSGFAGAIYGALFLERFVSEKTAWAHIDLMAWNVAHQDGRPEGGEAQAVRAVYALLADRYLQN